ncbi:beta-N-acetylhexosaminidase, partial [Clostridium perfringens]|nr:beta-N-acetylhexosaminidase [Clostridium perfringens]
MGKLKSKICTILSFVYLFTLTPTISFAETKATDVNNEVSLERALIPKPLSNYQTEGKFILTENTSIYVQGNTEEETDEIFKTGEYISNKFSQSTGFPFDVVTGANGPDGNIYLTTVGGEEE